MRLEIRAKSQSRRESERNLNDALSTTAEQNRV